MTVTIYTSGVPAVAQWVQIPTAVVWGSEEAWVQSLARFSELRIQSCHSGSDSIPGMGTFCHCRFALKKRKLNKVFLSLNEFIIKTISFGGGLVWEETLPEFTNRIKLWDQCHKYVLFIYSFIHSFTF